MPDILNPQSTVMFPLPSSPSWELKENLWDFSGKHFLGRKPDLFLIISHLWIFKSSQAHLRLRQKPTLGELDVYPQSCWVINPTTDPCPVQLEGLDKCFLWAKFFTTMLFYYSKQTKNRKATGKINHIIIWWNIIESIKMQTLWHEKICSWYISKWKRV